MTGQFKPPYDHITKIKKKKEKKSVAKRKTKKKWKREKKRKSSAPYPANRINIVPFSERS